MISDQSDRSAEHVVRYPSLLRAVNDQIHELSASLGGVDVPEYLCECGERECAERIAVPYDEYRRVRHGHPADFLVVPGHERPQLEEVVHRDFRWLVVRKAGVRAAVAAPLVCAH